jgi:GNAT superfamily N-acetyltransferase
MSHTDLRLKRLLPADAESGCALVASVGWEADLTNWRHYIRWGGEGAFGLFDGELLVTTTIAIQYSTELAWIASVVTNPAYQGRGLATRLMHTALEYLAARSVRCIMLDASVQGYGVYERLGFRSVYPLMIWSGGASQNSEEFTTEAQSGITALDASRLEAWTQVDASLNGVRRDLVLGDLLSVARGWADVDANGAIQGYALLRRRGKVGRIGPWYHRTPEGAEALLRTAVQAHGGPVRTDIPAPNEAAQRVAAACGLTHERSTTRMVYGADPPGAMAAQYGIASFATG